MLKTNSRKALQNLRNYIIESMDLQGHGYDEYAYIYEAEKENEYMPIKKDLWSMYKHALQDIYYKEKGQYYKSQGFKSWMQYGLFKDWMQGLPLLFDYYYHSAKKPIQNILEETEEEANKYTEEQAEELLTKLIYREVFQK